MKKNIVNIKFENDYIIFECSNGEVLKRLLHPKIKSSLSKMFGVIIGMNYKGKGVK